MRKFKKLLTALLSASMALSFSTVSAWAEDYTYTVTFYAGNQGTFANMDDLTVSGKEPLRFPWKETGSLSAALPREM